MACLADRLVCAEPLASEFRLSDIPSLVAVFCRGHERNRHRAFNHEVGTSGRADKSCVFTQIRVIPVCDKTGDFCPGTATVRESRTYYLPNGRFGPGG